MAGDAVAFEWNSVVAYSGSRQESKSLIPFDDSSWTVEVKDFVWFVLVGRVVSYLTTRVRRKMGGMALNWPVSDSSQVGSLIPHLQFVSRNQPGNHQ